jgi:hypothetical protein
MPDPGRSQLQGSARRSGDCGCGPGWRAPKVNGTCGACGGWLPGERPAPLSWLDEPSVAVDPEQARREARDDDDRDGMVCT